MPMLSVDDIRPHDLMRDQSACMQADIEYLLRMRDRFVDVNCPACDNPRRTHRYKKYDLDHFACDDCGTQYITPRPNAESLAEFYAQSANYAYWAKVIFPASADARRERIFKPRADLVRQLAERHGVSGSLVEVGSGFGLFCDEVRKLGLFSRIIGIEPTPDLAQVCRNLGFDCHEESYETLAIDEDVGLIAAFEVIEHLFSPQDFMKWCFRTLKPGGFLLLTCPNIAGFETVCLDRLSDTVDHEHLNLFNPRSFARLADRCGFEQVEVTTPGRLDLDIVKTAWESGSLERSQVGAFLAHVLDQGDENTISELQEFLRRSNLSSNMQMVAVRP